MAREYGQYCGLSRALELVGERWALLIVRDLLVGPRRYTDLQRGMPGVPTNILSTRLKELQEAGVVRRAQLAHCGPVYELTAYGRSLEDAVLALGRWGFQALGAPGADEVVTSDSLTMAFRTAFRAEVAERTGPTTYEVHSGPIRLRLAASAAGLRVYPVGSARPVDLVGGPPPGAEPELTIAAGPGIRQVISGELSPAEAIATGVVGVLAGDPALLERFAETFHLDPGPPREPLPTLT